MKPYGVVEHEHFFAQAYHEPTLPFYHKRWNDDINGRYDACLTEDDESFVWSPASNMHWNMEDYGRAKRVAEEMARKYAEVWPDGRLY